MFGRDTSPFAANADGEVRTLHWFVDNAYVGTSPPDGTVAWAPARTGRSWFVQSTIVAAPIAANCVSGRAVEDEWTRAVRRFSRQNLARS
jgi:membrane carboxypeptidase/penicillin-binding protein PbpC